MSAEQKIVEALVETNKELKAQVNILREQLTVIAQNDDRFVRFEIAYQQHNKIPRQCLADVRAEFGLKGFIDGWNASGEGYDGEHGVTQEEENKLFELYAQQLRDNDK